MAAAAANQQKRLLRQKVLGMLPKSFDIIQQQSRAIYERLIQWPAYQQSKSVGIYLNMPSGEVQTNLIVEHLLNQGKSCFVPVCDATTMRLVELRNLDDYKSLPLNNWKIPEPRLPEALERRQALASVNDGLDLIITPGVAFDLDGARLGHGKGYYDKFFAQCDQWAKLHDRTAPIKLGLALREQILPAQSIPMDPHDTRMNGILTPDTLHEIETIE